MCTHIVVAGSVNDGTHKNRKKLKQATALETMGRNPRSVVERACRFICFALFFVVAMISVVGKLEACISLRIEKRHQCFWKNFFYFSSPMKNTMFLKGDRTSEFYFLVY
jgi:hypothetical protein